MLDQWMSNAQAIVAAPSPEAASDTFFAQARKLGAIYLQTRLYRRPAGILTSKSHWAAGGFIRRIAAKGWAGSAAFNYVCFECNPLLDPIREGRTRFRFSDYAPRRERRFANYWDALGEAGISDALCVASYGSGGAIATLHLGFLEEGYSPEESLTIQMTGQILAERLLGFGAPGPVVGVHLTQREKDSIRLVAEGKTDWEVAAILGVSESTARFHIDNVRRKVGATTRAQTVALLINRRLI